MTPIPPPRKGEEGKTKAHTNHSLKNKETTTANPIREKEHFGKT